MKIYTRGGDGGSTSLIGGERVPKSDPRVEAYGSVDELMAFVGLLMTQEEAQGAREELMTIQRCLMCCSSWLALGGEVWAMAGKIPVVSKADVAMLEMRIDAYVGGEPPLRHFVLPGGHSSAVALTHVARTVCRRCERRIVEVEGVPGTVRHYVNRLSDYLFALGCHLAHQLGDEQIPWVS